MDSCGSEDLARAKGGMGASLLETGIGLRYEDPPDLLTVCVFLILLVGHFYSLAKSFAPS